MFNNLILSVAIYKYDNFQIDNTIDRPNGRNRSVADQESTIIAKEASLCAIASMASDPIHLLVVVPSMAFLGHVLPYTGMSDAKIAVNVPSIFKIKTQIDSLVVNSTDFISGNSSFFFHFPLWN